MAGDRSRRLRLDGRGSRECQNARAEGTDRERTQRCATTQAQCGHCLSVVQTSRLVVAPSGKCARKSARSRGACTVR